MDPILAIEVERLPGDRYTISWQPEFTRAGVTVFGGATPETIDAGAPLAREPGGRLTIEAGRFPYYFVLRPDDGDPLVVGARHLALEGATNFRDLGGYATVDGRRIRWGRLFRSGHLANLTESAQQTVADLGIHSVCDFRVSEEREMEAMVLPHRPELVTLAIPPGLNDRHYFQRLFARSDDPGDVVAALEAMLRGLVLELAERYRPMFDTLLAAPEGGVLFHCSAGKERTGAAMVFLLLALGVPRETIRHDFLLSKRYFPVEKEVPRVLRKYAVPNKTDEQLRPLIGPLLDTAASYVDAIFAAIDERASSAEEFLADRLGMSRDRCARLRDEYLTP